MDVLRWCLVVLHIRSHQDRKFSHPVEHGHSLSVLTHLQSQFDLISVEQWWFTNLQYCTEQRDVLLEATTKPTHTVPYTAITVNMPLWSWNRCLNQALKMQSVLNGYELTDGLEPLTGTSFALWENTLERFSRFNMRLASERHLPGRFLLFLFWTRLSSFSSCSLVLIWRTSGPGSWKCQIAAWRNTTTSACSTDLLTGYICVTVKGIKLSNHHLALQDLHHSDYR